MIRLGGQNLKLFVGGREIAKAYLGTTAIYSGTVSPGPPVEIGRAGAIIVRRTPTSFLFAGRAGVLIVRPSPRSPETHVGRAGVLVVRKAA